MICRERYAVRGEKRVRYAVRGEQISRERKESLREIETKKRKKYERNMQRERYAVREEKREKKRYAVRGERQKEKISFMPTKNNLTQFQKMGSIPCWVQFMPTKRNGSILYLYKASSYEGGGVSDCLFGTDGSVTTSASPPPSVESCLSEQGGGWSSPIGRICRRGELRLAS